jgi:hypothetical protein
MQSTSSDEKIEDAADIPGNGMHDLHATIDELKGRLEEINERVKGFIRARPVTCLAGALALGYVIARIARRRS